MKAKLNAILYIITIIIIIMLVIGYKYNEQQHKASVQQPNETKQHIEYNEEIKKIETETDKEVDAQAIEPVSLGVFKLTAYCPCEACCGIWANNRPNGVVYGAIGEELKEGYSIAVDPNVIPYRTEVIINGHIYRAQDCGGAIKGNRIDVYFEDHDDALEFGVQHAEVFVVTK